MSISDFLFGEIRDEDIHAAQRAPYRLLEEMPELSAGDPNAGNMLIQGDNLEALKALLPFYAGQVKCVYIDPPPITLGRLSNITTTIWSTPFGCA